MKKKFYIFMLAAAMAMTSLTGCAETDDEKETDVEDVVDDISDVVDEVIESHFYSVQSYGLNDAVLDVTRVNDSGEKEVEETGSEGWAGDAGMTIAGLMEEWGVVSIEAKCEGYELLGWQAYESIYEVDEDGFESFTEEKMYDGKVFTTEEMMNMELPDADIYFVTIWDLTCYKCEEKKVCEVYYIDDDCYFVCDDCYDEFAHEVGFAE